jgi:hypothetical protein
MDGTGTVFELIGNNGFTTEDYPYPELWAGVLRDMRVRRFEYFIDHLEPALFRSVVEGRTAFFRDTLEAIRTHELEVWAGATARISYLQNMLSHPWPDMRAAALDWMKAFYDLTVALGARYVSGHYDVIPKPDVARDLTGAVDRLCDHIVASSEEAKARGIEGIFIEVMHRAQLQPYTIEGAHYILERCRDAAVPVHLHYDTGHSAFVRGDPAHGEPDRDICQWLRTPFGRNELLLVHVQQCDDQASRHWPFTPEYNARGIVDGEWCIRAVEESGVARCVLSLEVLFPRGTEIEPIRRDLVESAGYWRRALSACGYREHAGEWRKGRAD